MVDGNLSKKGRNSATERESEDGTRAERYWKCTRSSLSMNATLKPTEMSARESHLRREEEQARRACRWRARRSVWKEGGGEKG